MSNQNVANFRLLHRNATPLRLANVWDAASARVFENAGATALATTSAGVAWSLGYRDGRSLPVDEAVAAAARIARVAGVPVSVDIENGYADDAEAAARTVLRLVDAGIAGINIEDGRDRPEQLAAKIESIRDAVARAGADLFVNARTDVVLARLAEPDEQVAETIRRGQLYARAGADGLFVPGLRVEADIRAVVAGVDLPLNVMAWGGLPVAAYLGKLGVRRLSAGSAIPQVAWSAAERVARAFLEVGDSDALLADAKAFGDVQKLFPDA